MHISPPLCSCTEPRAIFAVLRWRAGEGGAHGMLLMAFVRLLIKGVTSRALPLLLMLRDRLFLKMEGSFLHGPVSCVRPGPRVAVGRRHQCQ